MARRSLTAREAERLMDEYGICYGDDGMTFYAIDDDEFVTNDYGFGEETAPAIFSFDTKAERDAFVAA